MKYEFIVAGKAYGFTIAEPKDGYISKYNPGADIDGAWKFSLEILFFEFLKMFVPRVHELIDTSVRPESKETELNELDFSFGNKKLPSDQKPLSKDATKIKKPNKRIVDKLVKVKLKGGEDAFLLVHIEVQSRVKSYNQQLKFAARMHEYHKMLNSKFIGYKFINIGVLLNSTGPAVYKISKYTNPSLSYNFNSTFLDSANHDNVDYLIYKIKDIAHQEYSFKFPVIHLAKWLDREEELMDLAHSNPFAIIVLYQILALKHPNLLQRKQAKLQTIKILQLERRFAYSKELLDDLTRIMDRLIHLPKDLNNEFYKEVKEMGTTTEPRLISIFDLMARKEGLEEGLEQGLEQGLEKGLERGLTEGQASMLIEQLTYKFGSVTDNIFDLIKSASLEQIRVWSLNLLNAQTIDDVFKN